MRFEERYDVGDEVMIKVKIANIGIKKGELEYQVRVSDSDPVLENWFKKDSLVQIEGTKHKQPSKDLSIKIKKDLTPDEP